MATRQDRIDWLLNHQKSWEGFPDSVWSGGGIAYFIWQRLVAEMKVDGVLSNRTAWNDVAMPKLIQSARTLRRQRAAIKSNNDGGKR